LVNKTGVNKIFERKLTIGQDKQEGSVEDYKNNEDEDDNDYMTN
jgi:hypothetical protein